MFLEKLQKRVHVNRRNNQVAMDRKVKIKMNPLSTHALKSRFTGFLGVNKRVLINLFGFRRIPIAEVNKISYNSSLVVDAYAQATLKEPEKTIFDLLKPKRPFRRMLDIGVGAGRTTGYFAEIAEEYIGIDYSENMIKACSKKFQQLDKASFAVIDARNMTLYKDDDFDLVLFSHGGLDSVEHEDRIRILHEIWRVGKKGGCFCFSTSNLDAMLPYCQLKFSKHPKVFARMFLRLLFVRLLNTEMWKQVRGKQGNLKHTMFIVGGHDWGVKTYCIKPEAQNAQLNDLGFENIRIFDFQGKEIKHLPNTTSSELYYLCNIAKPD
jgi:ubiquinone/menaquinone biosynthesis C-methylase UbiE